MATVKYTGLISEFIGSIGGTTFQKTNSGNIVRLKPNQKFSSSQAQAKYMSIFSTIVNSWANLSGTQQLAWSAFATANPHINRWGSTKTLSGFQMFVMCNCNLINEGLPTIANAPLSYTWLAVQPYTIVAFANSLHIDWNPVFNNPSYDLVIYASAPTKAGTVKNRKNLFVIWHGQINNLSILDITSAYETNFGVTWSSLFNSGSYNIQFALLTINRSSGVPSSFSQQILSIRNYPAPNWSTLGTNWANIGTLASEQLVYSTLILSNNIALAATSAHAHILRSTDLGLTWSDLGQQGGQTYIFNLCELENGIVVAGSNPNGHIFRSTDFGLTWSDLGQQFSLSTILGFAYLGSGIVLAGSGSTGHILRSTDYGLTWSDLGQLGSASIIYFPCHLENGICLAGSASSGHIFRSTDFGLTWSDLGQLGSATTLYQITYCGNGIVIVGSGPSGHIFRSVDYGLTWSDLGQLGSATIIWSTRYVGNGIILFGSGASGHVFRSTDYGLTWSDLGQKFSQASVRGISNRVNSIILAGTGNNGYLIRSS